MLAMIAMIVLKISIKDDNSSFWYPIIIFLSMQIDTPMTYEV